LAPLVYAFGVMSIDSRSKTTVAADVWRRIFDFIIDTRAQRDGVLRRFGFTPGDSKALMFLDANEGRTMRSLAEAWTCDASNATWMIDRLEQRGLVERRSVVGDRRVKEVVLTPLGAQTKAALLEALYQPPPQLLELPLADLEALRDAIAKLPARAGVPGRSAEADPNGS
jgi:DNA-binding MarR family transcriptional regulator